MASIDNVCLHFWSECSKYRYVMLKCCVEADNRPTQYVKKILIWTVHLVVYNPGQCCAFVGLDNKGKGV
jgi:hypothetical protein